MADPVTELLGRLTSAEKLSLLHQSAPAIDRLGLAAFNTGGEAAHSVAWRGTATVFPQPVGLAATWDPELLRRLGAVVGTELRAKRLSDPSIGLNVWAPVVNPLRHPRWGRNEEGLSEDPWLTAELATGYARGLRGDLERWRVVPTLKHFCGYNNETDRDVSSSVLSRRVLHEYELPAYRGPIAAGAAGAVMASYNLINGRPAHVSADLLDELRSWTDDSLLVVSDAYAPGNLAGSQRYFEDHPAGYAAALRAGVDSYTQDDARPAGTLAALTEALERGLITEADVDRAAERVLRLRERTGELDETDPYAAGPDKITEADLDRPEHRSLAREAVAASIVLLRNENLLPLQPTGRIAVIGPLADRVLCDWYSGTPPYRVSLADALSEAVGDNGEVRLVDGADRVALMPLSPVGEQTLAGSQTRPGYLRTNGGVITADGVMIGGSPESAAVVAITDWGHGICTITADTGKLWTVSDGRWVRADADRVGGWEVQQSFRLHRRLDGSCSIQHLGTRKWLRVDAAGALCVEVGRAEEATRFRTMIISDGCAAAADAADWADTVIVTVGNEPHLLGRETEDRPDLELPQSLTGLITTARQNCDRTVLAIISSYPYALDDVAAGSPAIVWSSHGGQELGHGLVDVLTGAADPGGRLAQAWPRLGQRLPDLLDYDIIGSRSTYWYDDQPPLFPFGHGLGYGEVRYQDLAIETGPDSVPVGAVVTVHNPGDRSMSEVVQAYTTAVEPRLAFPRRLAGFTKITLAPGETRRVVVELRREAFMIFDVVSSRMIIETGAYEVRVGSSVDDIRLQASVSMTGETVGPHPLEQGFAATAFDQSEDVRLVPRDPLRDEVVEADDGRIAFLAVDPGTSTTLELRVRNTARRSGRVTAWFGDHCLGTVPTDSQWTTQQLPISGPPARLELRLQSAAVDTLRGR
ncbi:beta-glucosidase family protein [Microlunatus elymi]|uniref:beta-glucosidase family protein n=1 Tax=Microlunatus elymi TaxID=2596828 RepID=UPI001AEFC765|nr:glycoside hydrolase family 3 C-terminal domain-containing protein [Microlunatus elymi]